MQSLKVTELNAFSGGMNNVTAPYLIAKDESTLLVNVDIRRGAMWSMPRPIKHSDVDLSYFFQFKGDVYTYGSWRSNVLWDNKWYWSDGATTGKILADGTEDTLGLPTPIVALTATPGGADSGPHTGDFKYTYTFYNITTGVESAPAPLTPYITLADMSVSLDGADALPAGATHYRLYRIGGYLPYFMMIDKTSVLPFVDGLDDTQIDGRILQTLRNGPPPGGIHYFTEMNGRLFGAVGNKVYYSALGNPDSWYVYDVIPCQDIILGLAKVPGGLLVMGNTWSNILKGTDPINFRLQVISDKVGIVDASSLAYVDQNACWLSNHGIVLSNGYNITQLTSDKIENLAGLRPTGAAVLNNVYHLAYQPQLFPSEELFPGTTLYPNAVEGTGGIDQGILTIDFKRGNGYSYRLFNVPDIRYLSLLDGDIGGIRGQTETYSFECGEIGFPDCFGRLACHGLELVYINKATYTAETALDNMAEIEYISPILVDGTTTTLKEYDKIRLVFKGSFLIQVLFDNDRLIIERAITSIKELDYDDALIGIPNADNKAYSIRFIVRGIGIIKGIQYSFKGRELP